MTEGRLHINNKIIKYHIWQNMPSHHLGDGTIVEYLRDDLQKTNLLIEDIKNYCWIVDTGPEGISAEDIEPFRQFLVAHGVTKFGAAFTTYTNTEYLSYPAICLPDQLITNGDWLPHLHKQNVDWANIPMTHKLVCPMRRGSWSRASLAKCLFGILKPEEMVISLGTNGDYASEEMKALILPHGWPLIVDSHTADNQMQHALTHVKFYTAPLKIVVETSSDIDEDGWTGQFVTEKTYKALSWYQLPIWFAVPGLVARIREQGFDVFDDVIDHSYDNVHDGWERMERMLLELQRLLRLDTVQLRQDLWNRFKNNAKLVEDLLQNSYQHHDKIEEFTGKVSQ